jgi:hypothetical protein
MSAPSSVHFHEPGRFKSRIQNPFFDRPDNRGIFLHPPVKVKAEFQRLDDDCILPGRYQKVVDPSGPGSRTGS